MKRLWRILSIFLWLTVVWLAAGAVGNWRMKSKVAEGLDGHGRGLEYGEWLVNFLLVVGMALVVGVCALLCTWRAIVIARKQKREETVDEQTLVM